MNNPKKTTYEINNLAYFHLFLYIFLDILIDSESKDGYHLNPNST